MRVRPPDPDRPDYFDSHVSSEEEVIRRIKGNARRLLVAEAIRSEGLHQVPDRWKVHELSEDSKCALQAEHAQARGGEDLPDLIPGEVEIARMTLVSSVSGEVTSLRASRDPCGLGIWLSMVDEHGTEFRLPETRVAFPLTAGEILSVFRDADPSPLDTHCEICFSSFFYTALDEWADAMGMKYREVDPTEYVTWS